MKNIPSFTVKLFLLLLMFISSFGLNAKTPFDVIDQRFLNTESSIPSYIQFGDQNQPELNDLNKIFEDYWKNESDFSFRLIKTEIDKMGQTHYRYQQEYKGISIEFAELFVHTKGNEISSVNGKILDKAPVNLESSINEAEALQIALNYIGAKLYKWEIPEEELHLKHENKDESASYFPKGELVYIGNSTSIESNSLKLAYKFNVYAQEPLSRREIYINVSNRKVLFENSLIHTSNVKGSATTVYSGVKTINTDSTATNSFRLRQTVSGGGVNTYDLRKSTTISSAVDFLDANNVWSNLNANKDQYATDAHWGAEQTYDYYFTSFGRNSINGNGFILNSYLHYSTNYANAFWDGQRMTYGDGNASVNPLVSLDIAGHEITHGLTTFTANLIYQAESGALNESFSDIFGTAIEFYGKSTAANWTIGENIGRTLRSMSNPNSYGDPDTYDGTNWKNVVACVPTQQNDQCGVHSNSGVQNFWFYLLTNGGSGTNDHNNAYSVTGLGIDTAAAIAFRNLTVYLGRTSDYNDARFYSILAAVDLYGPCSKQVEATTNAWHAVGVGPAYVAGVLSDFVSGDTVQCKTPFAVRFENKSNNGIAYFWDFGDGDTSILQHPIHQYMTYGQFDVKLITDGGTCGIDSITYTNYVDIDSSNSCVVNMENGVNPTQFECSGKLFDGGGSGGNYLNNQTSTITIAPPNAASITIDFKQFDIEVGTNNACNFDYLEIFDGPSVNSPSLGVYCNGTGSPGIKTSTFGSITIKFVSDPGLTKAGFEMEWSCNYPTAAPIADFINSADTTCTGKIKFNDYSTNAPNTWFWDFGDGKYSTEQDPAHTYASNGSYSVKLVSGNSFGVDSISKTNVIVVNRPQKATITNDTICANSSANLTANGQGVLNWYTSEEGGNAIYTGSNFTANNIAKDSSFWVEDYILAPTQIVGPTSNSIGGGQNYSGAQYLTFDVLEEVQLISVRVYGGSAGNRTIELRDNNGVVLHSAIRYVSAGALRITLNFDLKPGINYQLGVSTVGGGPDLYRNNTGVTYPYTIPGKISIKGSSAGANYYYFFYNWRLKSADCSAIRAESKVVIDSTCTVTSLNENFKEGEKIGLYPNPTSNQLTLDLSSDLEVELIELFDIQGKVVSATMSRQKKRRIFDVSGFDKGVYFIRCQTNQETFIKKFIVN